MRLGKWVKCRVALLAGLAAMGAGCDPDPEAATVGNDAGSGDAAADATPWELCPDPEHPRVHYVRQDPNACADVELQCSSQQTGFDNQCGCGCLDPGDPLCPPVFDPNIRWISRDPEDCPESVQCPPDDTPFDNSCGCGCTTH